MTMGAVVPEVVRRQASGGVAYAMVSKTGLTNPSALNARHHDNYFTA